MKYRDNGLYSEQEYSNLRENYRKARTLNISGLYEIIAEMENQLNALSNCNKYSKYNKFIDTNRQNTEALRELVRVYENENTKKSSGTLLQQILSKFNLRSQAPRRESSNASNRPMDIPTDNVTNSPPVPSELNGNSMRNRTGDIDNFLNLIDNDNIVINSTQVQDNLRYHTIVNTKGSSVYQQNEQNSICNTHDKIITNELNIVRLIILHLKMYGYNAELINILESEYNTLLELLSMK